jgi:hypothetical protein
VGHAASSLELSHFALPTSYRRPLRFSSVTACLFHNRLACVYDGIYTRCFRDVKNKMSTPVNHVTACPICAARQKAGTTEVFVLTEGLDRHFFDVDRAKQLVEDGRSPVPISTSTVLQLLAVNEHEFAHLAHVDITRPGILALRFGGVVLLDGIHRAARCLRERRPFLAYMLDHEESKACIVREDIVSRNPLAIAQKLRRVLGTAIRTDPIEAAIDCSPETLEEVRKLLTPAENSRLLLRLLRSEGRH